MLKPSLPKLNPFLGNINEEAEVRSKERSVSRARNREILFCWE